MVRADHDYIELLVDVKEEPEDEGEDQAAEPEEFHSLSTLAEVSMATAGHQIAPGLQEEIFRARQNWKPQQQYTTAAASAIAHHCRWQMVVYVACARLGGKNGWCPSAR